MHLTYIHAYMHTCVCRYIHVCTSTCTCDVHVQVSTYMCVRACPFGCGFSSTLAFSVCDEILQRRVRGFRAQADSRVAPFDSFGLHRRGVCIQGSTPKAPVRQLSDGFYDASPPVKRQGLGFRILCSFWVLDLGSLGVSNSGSLGWP